MSDGQAGRALAMLRIVAGAGAWLTPNLTARILGLPAGGPLAFVLRLFGVRDVVLGLGYLNASPDDRNNWLRMGMVADAGDAVAAVVAVRRGAVPARTGIPLALTAVGASVAAASEQSR